MKIGCSALTSVIYAGTTRNTKAGEIWTKKTDVTDEAIRAVFQHMYDKAEETGCYEYSFKGFGKMQLIRESEDK